ncbi:MAG: sensor histidine kinase [Parasphingopyxis sp.]
MGKYLKFMAEGGRMGERIRARDWSDTPFGPPADWPQSLRSTLSTCLRSSIPTAIYWGEELRLLYNDAWAPIPGPRHPGALGAPAREIWPDIWEVLGPQLAHVRETREGLAVNEQMLPMQRYGAPEETYWDYSLTPIVGEDGLVVGILNQGQEVTNRVFQRRREQLLLDLDSMLRVADHAGKAMQQAVERLAPQLPAERVGYGVIDDAVETITVEACWTDGTLADVTGSHPVAIFGEALHRSLREGEVISVFDCAEDERITGEPGLRDRYRAMGLRSGLVVPLIRDGRYSAAMFAHSAEPHRWTDNQVALLQTVGERIWQAAARIRTEARLRESERHHRLIVETAQDIVFSTDLEQIVTACNPAAGAALCLPHEEIVGRAVVEFLDPADLDYAAGMLRQKIDDGGTTRYEITVISAGGERMRWEINSTLAYDLEGQVIGIHAIARDMTERHAFDQRQKLLINELNHRVKNTLALVQSLAMQSFKPGVDPDAAREIFQTRLGALAAAHDLLTREHWEGATLGELIAAATDNHIGDDGQIEATGPALRIAPRAAVSLAMALHELCTNAAKYGALSGAEGRISIAWQVEDGMLRLGWREQGGPEVSQPDSRGFGLRMIERALASDLAGEVVMDFDPAGLRCHIEAPLDAIAPETKS